MVISSVVQAGEVSALRFADSYPTAKIRFRVTGFTRDGVHKTPDPQEKFRFGFRTIGWEKYPERSVTAVGSSFSDSSFELTREDIKKILTSGVAPGSLDFPLAIQLQLNSLTSGQPKTFDVEVEVTFNKSKVLAHVSDAPFAMLYLWRDPRGSEHADLFGPLTSPNEHTAVPFYFPAFSTKFCLRTVDGKSPEGKFRFGILGSNRKLDVDLSSPSGADSCTPPFVLSPAEITHGLVFGGGFLYPFGYPIHLLGTMEDTSLKRHPSARYELEVEIFFPEIAGGPQKLSYSLMPFEEDIHRGYLDFGFLVWRDHLGQPTAASFTEYNRRRYYLPMDTLAPVPPLKHFTIADGLFADNDINNWKEGFEHLGKLGINTVGTALNFNPAIRAAAKEAGMKGFKLEQVRPLESNFEFRQPPTTPRVCELYSKVDYENFASKLIEPARRAGVENSEISLVGIADEPIWGYPIPIQKCESRKVSAQVLNQFRGYLKKISIQEGLRFPKDFGKAKEAQLDPLFDRELAKSSLANRRLYYWTMRFFPWYSAQHYARATKAIQNELRRPDEPVYANLNNFTGQIYRSNEKQPKSLFTGGGNHDWFGMAKVRGTTLPWTEDWNTDQDNYMWSFLSTLLRSAAKSGGLADIGSYVVARQSDYSHDKLSGGLLRKVLTLIGNGAKTINYYIFGPEYFFPANSYSEDIEVQKEIASINRMIGDTEDLLFPGQPEDNQVGFVLPLSSAPWDFSGDKNSAMDWFTEHGLEAPRLFLALKNANLPVEFLHEDDLFIDKKTGNISATLKRFKVIYLTEPNLPKRAQEALKVWVKQEGGTLATVAGAASRDEYDQSSSFLEDANFFGLKENRVTSLQVGASHFENDPRVKPYGQTQWENRANESLQNRRLEVEAKFSDGKPAVIRKKVGKGNVVHFAWLPGASYYLGKCQPAIEKPHELPVDYSDVLREWIAFPSRLSGFQPLLLVDKPLVETFSLSSPQGDAIVLINWTNDPLKKIQVTLNDARWPKTYCAISAQHGAVKVTEDPQTHLKSFSLPLKVGDIVRLYLTENKHCTR